MDAFAAHYLFAPLGITDHEWDQINADMIHASGNLQLRPRDMAKFGSLYLNDGVWNGQQIVSREWVKVSTLTHTVPRWDGGYGYQWWLRTYEAGSKEIDAFHSPPACNCGASIGGGVYRPAATCQLCRNDPVVSSAQLCYNSVQGQDLAWLALAGVLERVHRGHFGARTQHPLPFDADPCNL